MHPTDRFNLAEILTQANPPEGGWESIIREHAARIAGCHNRTYKTKLLMLRDLHDTISSCAIAYPLSYAIGDPANERFRAISNCAFHIAIHDRHAPHMEWNEGRETKMHHAMVAHLARALYYLGTDEKSPGQPTQPPTDLSLDNPVIERTLAEVDRQIANVQRRASYKYAKRQKTIDRSDENIVWVAPQEPPMPAGQPSPRIATPCMAPEKINGPVEPGVFHSERL